MAGGSAKEAAPRGPVAQGETPREAPPQAPLPFQEDKPEHAQSFTPTHAPKGLVVGAALNCP